MNPEHAQSLIAAACDVRQRAYARYSHFPVGAAIRTTKGDIFAGCNVENASYGLTICAERVAICNAIAHGQHQFDLLAIATSQGDPPCGACRQILAEFCDDLEIWLVAADCQTAAKLVQLKDLLPSPFRRTRAATDDGSV